MASKLLATRKPALIGVILSWPASIIDDGAGLNRERILAKEVENNIEHDPDMPDEKVWNLIFAAGFSTAD